jgi:TRAP-type C4-dicarboxylate transport system substrate-binding protein
VELDDLDRAGGLVRGDLLLELAEKWKEQSNGDVELKVYSGGVTGNEGDTVTKMGVGQVQAAAITIVGMRNIDPAPQAAGVPGLLTTDAEFNYVVEKMEPVWEKRLLEKGYVVLSWGDTGWIHFFAKKALHKPADAEGVKIFAWAGDPNAVEAWKASGFQPVVPANFTFAREPGPTRLLFRPTDEIFA